MPEPRPSAAGGVAVALGSIGGTAVGLIYGEPSRGFLIGLALGVAIALLHWWRSR